MKSDNSVKHSLELLSKRWRIDPEVYDLHLSKRSDVVDTVVEVNKVIFHIPTLADERQGRLPLIDDIEIIAKKMGYVSKAEFIS